MEAALKKTFEYETDFYSWTQEQATFLRNRVWNSLDISNLAEEIESLGKQQRQELRNRLGVLLGHLLKWEFQESHRSRSWLRTIKDQRLEVSILLKESPSLKPYLYEALSIGYEKGLYLAIEETLLDESIFPSECQYTLDQVLEPSFLPGKQPEL